MTRLTFSIFGCLFFVDSLTWCIRSGSWDAATRPSCFSCLPLTSSGALTMTRKLLDSDRWRWEGRLAGRSVRAQQAEFCGRETSEWQRQHGETQSFNLRVCATTRVDSCRDRSRALRGPDLTSTSGRQRARSSQQPDLWPGAGHFATVVGLRR